MSDIKPAVYGIRVKGSPGFVGVLPVKLKDFPVKNPEWDGRYEEVALYEAISHQAGPWQPIETAPKDASWIMLGMVGRNEILLGFWHSLMNAWWGQGGSAGEWKKWERATHWQPLPEPPNVP